MQSIFTYIEIISSKEENTVSLEKDLNLIKIGHLTKISSDHVTSAII